MTWILLAASLLSHPAAAAKKPKVPDAIELLRRSLEPAVTSYEGQLLTESGKRQSVRFQNPGRYRRQALASDGQWEMLVVSDGSKEWVYEQRRNKVWEGEPADPEVKQLAPEEELELLTANYHVAASTGEPVAGRPSWLLELRARAGGGLRRRHWVDRRSGLILASQSYGSDGSLIGSMRFERLSFPGRQRKELFSFTPPSGAVVVKRIAPDYLSLDEAAGASGMKPRLPLVPSGTSLRAWMFCPGSKKIILPVFDGWKRCRCSMPARWRMPGSGRKPQRETWTWKRGADVLLVTRQSGTCGASQSVR